MVTALRFARCARLLKLPETGGRDEEQRRVLDRNTVLIIGSGIAVALGLNDFTAIAVAFILVIVMARAGR